MESPSRYSALPADIRQRDQWVCWRSEVRGAKTTKVPLSARTLTPASTTNPADWSSFGQAVAGAAVQGVSGIGYVFAADDDICGVDLDDAFRADRIERTRAIVERLGSYTEISPSGTGVHILLRASLPGGLGRRRDGIEVYDRARYFACTGLPWLESPTMDILPAQEALAEVMARYLAIAEVPAQIDPSALPARIGSPLPTDALMDMIERDDPALWSTLHDGWEGRYPSGSEADMGASRRLAWWTGGDVEQSLEILRGSALWDEKWERESYQRPTLVRPCVEAVAAGHVFGRYLPSMITEVDVTPDPEPVTPSVLTGLRVDIFSIDAQPPAPVDMIPGLLPDPEWSRFALMVGTGSVGKSMLALQMLTSLTCGLPVAGRWMPARTGNVLYLSGEDGLPALRWRMWHIMQALKLSSEQRRLLAERMHLFDLVGRGLALMEYDGRNYRTRMQALDEIAKYAAPYDPLVIAVDTLSRFAAGAESDNERAAAFVLAMEALGRHLNTTILVLHHTSKRASGGLDQHTARGASTLSDNARHVLTMSHVAAGKDKLPDPLLARLYLPKASYALRTGQAAQLKRHTGGVLQWDTEALTEAEKVARKAVVDWVAERDLEKGKLTRETAEKSDLFLKDVGLKRHEALKLIDQMVLDGDLNSIRGGWERSKNELLWY